MTDERQQRRDADKHQVLMVNRQYVEITGVHNVESFDTRAFVLATSVGMMALRGENLHIKALHLESGLVSIEGAIGDLTYSEERVSAAGRARGLFGRLLK